MGDIRRISTAGRTVRTRDVTLSSAGLHASFLKNATSAILIHYNEHDAMPRPATRTTIANGANLAAAPDDGDSADAIGRRLEALRDGRALSLAALAKHLHMSTSYLWRLERGLSSNPSRKVTGKIARFFNVDASTFRPLRSAAPLAEDKPANPPISDDALLAVFRRLTDSQRRDFHSVAVTVADANDLAMRRDSPRRPSDRARKRTPRAPTGWQPPPPA